MVDEGHDDILDHIDLDDALDPDGLIYAHDGASVQLLAKKVDSTLRSSPVCIVQAVAIVVVTVPVLRSEHELLQASECPLHISNSHATDSNQPVVLNSEVVEEQDMLVDHIMGSSLPDSTWATNQVDTEVVLGLEDDEYVSRLMLLPTNDVRLQIQHIEHIPFE